MLGSQQMIPALVHPVRDGFMAPLRLVARAFRSPLWARYRKTALWQSALVLGVAVGATFLSDDLESLQRKGELFTLKGGATAWSTFVGALFVTQWITIALSHSYHEHFDTELRRITDLPQDPPPKRAPSKRIHWDWVRWDIKNRWLGLVTLVFGEILLSPLLLFDVVGDVINAALLIAWGFYWLMVFVAYATSFSQYPPVNQRPPWLHRFLDTMTNEIPGLRWWFPRWVARLWRRLLAPIDGPMAWVERSPWPLAGLALARLVFGAPIVWLWLRPVFAAAVAEVLSRQGAVVGPTRRSGSTDSLPRL